MKREAFEELKKKLKSGDYIEINYRCNWRGGDGRPHDHRKGKTQVGHFNMIFHDGILLREMEFPINYKAIKFVKDALDESENEK
jgi:hypothetical protein